MDTTQETLRYLQHQVAVLKHQLEEKRGSSDTGKSPGGLRGASKAAGVPATPQDLSGVFEQSPAGALVGDMRFVDAANWEAILDDVSPRMCFPRFSC